MSELKPCPVPWCKSTEPPKVLSVWGSHQFTVRCLSCKDIFRWGDTEAEAIEAWNHRPFEAHAVDVLAEKLYKLDIIGDPFYYSWENARADHKEQHRAEARALLGIKE